MNSQGTAAIRMHAQTQILRRMIPVEFYFLVPRGQQSRCALLFLVFYPLIPGEYACCEHDENAHDVCEEVDLAGLF